MNTSLHFIDIAAPVVDRFISGQMIRPGAQKLNWRIALGITSDILRKIDVSIRVHATGAEYVPKQASGVSYRYHLQHAVLSTEDLLSLVVTRRLSPVYTVTGITAEMVELQSESGEIFLLKNRKHDNLDIIGEHNTLMHQQ